MRQCEFIHEKEIPAACRRSCQRLKMLTGWIAVAAFLAASADPASAAIGQRGLTVEPTCRVKGHSEVELTLSCGDEKSSGVVQFWHTPFGDLETSGFLSTLDPVFVHHDGSLVVPNASTLHSGLYYCLLKHAEGSTLWPYELSVGHGGQTDAERTADEPLSCGASRFRFRRDVRSGDGRQGGVSDEQFAGAVVASVLLTFVVGFSTGALSRAQVLRCLGALAVKLKAPRQQQQSRQADTPDHGPQVGTPTRPNKYNNEALEMEEMAMEEDSAMNVTMESTVSSTSSPPAKPKRSFRQKREEEPETTAYLEGCDYMKVERKETVEEEQRKLKENYEACDEVVEDREVSCSFYISEKDDGSDDGREEDECREDQEQKDGRESREEKEEASEEANALESSSSSNEDKEDSTGSEEEDNKETRGEEEREGLGKENEANDEVDKRKEDVSSNGEKEEDAVANGEGGGEPAPSPPPRGRRRRIIRLYQYDEDGQRYGHLPNPTPDEPGPAPRLKQRSLSLTRLNAIMAASAGPLDTRETGKEEEKPHFHMMI